MSANLVALLYLVSGVLFIMALRGLSSPESSRQGNLFGMIGMAIAIGTTLSVVHGGYLLIVLGLAIGGVIGAYIANKIPMTAMPQLVAAFHSLVGLAAWWIGSPLLLSLVLCCFMRVLMLSRLRGIWSLVGCGLGVLCLL